jgi:transcriptional regulator GlxA family with amidase domain
MRVAMLAFPGVQMLDLVGPMDVFDEANRQLRDPSAYTLAIVAPRAETTRGANGLRFLPDLPVDALEDDIDTLLVPGSVPPQEVTGEVAYDPARDRALLGWLARQPEHVRRIGSISNGAFVLAAAGLLDGRRATTHWASAARLAVQFPRVRIEPDRIYVKDGPIYTSAGVTAGMDLALAMLEEDHGHGSALRVARQLVMFVKRPGGQSQFSLHSNAPVAQRTPIRETQEWIFADLTGDLSVEALASRAGMSLRNFARMFKRETSETPGDFVEIARVEAARRMLEDSDTPLKKVASQCGFSDQNSLRRAFMRRLGVSPVEYRQRFRSTRSGNDDAPKPLADDPAQNDANRTGAARDGGPSPPMAIR